MQADLQLLRQHHLFLYCPYYFDLDYYYFSNWQAVNSNFGGFLDGYFFYGVSTFLQTFALWQRFALGLTQRKTRSVGAAEESKIAIREMNSIIFHSVKVTKESKILNFSIQIIISDAGCQFLAFTRNVNACDARWPKTKLATYYVDHETQRKVFQQLASDILLT